MNNTFRDALATHGTTLISHIELQAADDTPIASGRQAVTWTGPDANGIVRPDADLPFDTASGEEVAKWVGFSAATGGTNYGGDDLTTVNYNNDGTYTLLAAQTGIDVSVS